MPLFEGLSYGGEKTAVVLDVGAAFTKCGFAGENGPRCIIPSQVKRPKTKLVAKVYTHLNSEDLYGVLVDFVHFLYFRHLLVNPKERRVVVVESLLNTTVFRETLAKVLFKHFEVPSVLFAPSHLVALFTLGIPSGLVLDAGYSESQVIPVYEGIPVLKSWQALPIAAKAIHNAVESRLMESGTVKTQQMVEKPLSAVVEKLDEAVIEDIKVRCCFVTRLERAKQIVAASGEQVPEGGDATQAPAPPPSVDYPLEGGNILHVDGKIRERACEVLFEQDNEEQSVATLLLDALVECPVDMRRPLADNIVLIGGTCMLPGFKPRLQRELQTLLAGPKYREKLAIGEFKFHKPPCKANSVAWLGGAIFGALEVLGSRSVSKETYGQKGCLPDWASLQEGEDIEEKPGVKR